MARDPLEIINAHDLMTATGIRPARAITGRGTGWAWGGREFWGEDAWDRMVAASGIEAWVTPATVGSWWPAEIIEKAKALGLRNRSGKLLSWKQGRPCDETVTREWSSHRCERVVVGSIEVRSGPEGTAQRFVCGLHLKAAEKAAARHAEWRERWDRDRELVARQREHRQLAEELLAWAGELLAELGIHPATITVGSIGDRTGLLLPAEAVATLIQEATGERYPGRDRDLPEGRSMRHDPQPTHHPEEDA